jgi:hypothetical protein
MDEVLLCDGRKGGRVVLHVWFGFEVDLDLRVERQVGDIVLCGVLLLTLVVLGDLRTAWRRRDSRWRA